MPNIKSSVRSISYNTGDSVLLKENPKRVGFIVENDTNTSMYLAYGDREASANDRSLSIAATSTYEYQLPKDRAYTGVIRFALDNATSGKVFVTEFWSAE